jgi:hypothetical protein
VYYLIERGALVLLSLEVSWNHGLRGTARHLNGNGDEVSQLNQAIRLALFGNTRPPFAPCITFTASS